MKKKSILGKGKAWTKIGVLLCTVSLNTFIVFGNNETDIKNEINSDLKVEAEFAPDVSDTKKTRPSWISTKGSPKVVKKDNAIYIDYTVTYKNNSKNGEILTAIYDKTLQLQGTLNWKYTSPDPYNGKMDTWSGSKEFKYTLKSSKVSKVEVYPGQTTKVTYRFDVKKGAEFDKYDWERAYKNEVTFKTVKWSHDFQATSKE
jgi:hypothetical protein